MTQTTKTKMDATDKLIKAALAKDEKAMRNVSWLTATVRTLEESAKVLGWNLVINGSKWDKNGYTINNDHGFEMAKGKSPRACFNTLCEHFDVFDALGIN